METLNTTRPTSTRVTGRVVRGQGIAYTLTTGRGSTEVVRGRQATFVRDRAGHWQRLRHPHPLTDPTGSLLAILTGITQTYLIAPGVIVALLPQEAARHAGLLGGRDPVQVRILLDRAGHVVRLETTTTASVGTRRIALTVDTHYGQFGRVPPIRMPA